MFKESDINFRIDETKYTRSGIGLIPKISLNGEEIYKSKLLWCDIESRIELLLSISFDTKKIT